MLNYLEYLNTPTRIVTFLVGVFLCIQIIGEILEFKGKFVPEYIKTQVLSSATPEQCGHDPENDLFYVDASIARIKAWQNKIAPYVSNDTGEDMSIYDSACGWGNLHDYKLMTKGTKNFFQTKAQTVNNMK